MGEKNKIAGAGGNSSELGRRTDIARLGDVMRGGGRTSRLRREASDGRVRRVRKNGMLHRADARNSQDY